jgi:hypothetical protein
MISTYTMPSWSVSKAKQFSSQYTITLPSSKRSTHHMFETKSTEASSTPQFHHTRSESEHTLLHFQASSTS